MTRTDSTRSGSDPARALTFDAVGRLLMRQAWIFARTMPDSPHWYTLRKDWDDADFVQVVTYLRANGYPEKYKGRWYTQLDVNEYFYWTMGAPLDQTILINRKIIDRPEVYDDIAPIYDELFEDAASQQESIDAVALLGDLSDQSVLDVGCGTGLLLDCTTVGRYTGIDPSRAMLNRFRQKHPHYAQDAICAPLRAYVGDPVDHVVALFGAASYLSRMELQRLTDLLRPGGRYDLMLYAPGYTPVTYEKTGIYVSHQLYDHYPPGEVVNWHQYVIVRGGREDLSR